MNTIKKYLFNKIKNIILYFVYDHIKQYNIHPLHNRCDRLRDELLGYKNKNDNRFIIQDWNIKFAIQWLDKLSKNSITWMLDVWSMKSDNTMVCIISRMRWQERVEFFENKFSSLKELEEYIKRIKIQSDNIYIDVPRWMYLDI
jgi:hypothetical protein